jgi:hypothetical protein
MTFIYTIQNLYCYNIGINNQTFTLVFHTIYANRSFSNSSPPSLSSPIAPTTLPVYLIAAC